MCITCTIFLGYLMEKIIGECYCKRKHTKQVNSLGFIASLGVGVVRCSSNNNGELDSISLWVFNMTYNLMDKFKSWKEILLVWKIWSKHLIV